MFVEIAGRMVWAALPNGVEFPLREVSTYACERCGEDAKPGALRYFAANVYTAQGVDSERVRLCVDCVRP